MKHIVVISDTHGNIDKRFIKYLKKADEIWHAGDIGNLKTYNSLLTYSKVIAVFGNIDDNKIRTELDKTIFFHCENKKILMTHISGSTKKNNDEINLEIKKNKPDIFISGHSHILKISYDKKNKMLCINPGAAGKHGIHFVKTIVCFDIDKENIKNLNIVELSRSKSSNSIS